MTEAHSDAFEAESPKGALKDRPIFAVFEGGGALGIAHVGALRAIEDGGAPLKGVAGTSAGAIIAALASAGFEARRLYDDDTDRSIFDEGGFPHQQVTDLLGANAWRTLRAVRGGGRVLHWLAKGKWCWAAAGGLGLGGLLCLGVPMNSIAIAALSLIGAVAVAAIAVGCFGLVSLGELRKNLNALLVEQALQHNPATSISESGLSFADAGALGWVPLKIVASNLNQRRIEVFSLDTTPQVAIADAVMASICIPLLFRPIYLRAMQATYVDGGMLSNLPAWAFEEERCLTPDAAIVAIELEEAGRIGERPRRLNGPAYLRALIHTALFGAASLSKRVSGLLIPLSLRALKRDGTPLTLLEFDIARADAREIIRDARAVAQEKLLDQLVSIPTELRRFTENVRDLVCHVMQDESFADLFDQSDQERTVRVAIATRPRDHLRNWRLHDGAGFEDDHPDRGVFLPDPGSLVAKAVSNGKGRIEIATAEELARMSREADAAGAALQARAWPELCWSIAIPPLDEALNSVLVIDSNVRLATTPERLRHRLDNVLSKIQNLHTQLQPRIHEMDPR